MRSELRKFYGHLWRTVDRPAALLRAGHECVRCAIPDRPMGLRSSLDGAHLDGNPQNRSDENIAVLCRRCHRAADYAGWALKYGAWLTQERERRADLKDAGRPILQMLKSEELARCDREIARIDAEGAIGAGPAWLNAMGRLDWMMERALIERDSLLPGFAPCPTIPAAFR